MAENTYNLQTRKEKKINERKNNISKQIKFNVD